MEYGYQNTAYLIVVDNNNGLYNICFDSNDFIKQDKSAIAVRYDNSKENKSPTVLFNRFLDSYDFTKDAWFIFCHNDWEIRQPPSSLFCDVATDYLYGPIGAALTRDKRGRYVREYSGGCYENSRDGSTRQYLKCIRNSKGIRVDTVDGQALIMHSSLVQKYGLRFDENLFFDLYVEDFCLNAKVNHDIYTLILPIKCCHWSIVGLEDIRPQYFESLAYLDEKYSPHLFAGVVSLIGARKDVPFKNLKARPVPIHHLLHCYKATIGIIAKNNSHALIYDFIEENSRVLDVGSAAGYLGSILVENKNCRVFGIDNNEYSTAEAEKTGAYERIDKIDLNLDFDLQARYDEKFDHVVLGDIIEHLVDPDRTIDAITGALKQGGKIILSIPNVGHASIKMSLLDDEWEYTEVGLLDETHLRFYTHKSIAKLMAAHNYLIEEMRYTVADRGGQQHAELWTRLPRFVSSFVCSNPHSFVFQYVIKAKQNDRWYSLTELLEHNLDKMAIPKDSYESLLKKCMDQYKVLSFFWRGWYLAKRALRRLRGKDPDKYRL